MIEPPTTLGFPNEKVTRVTEGEHAPTWHYFCEPLPGYVALIEPNIKDRSQVFVNFYKDDPDFKYKRYAGNGGRYVTVCATILNGVSDVPDLLTAACHIHRFIQEHQASAA